MINLLLICLPVICILIKVGMSLIATSPISNKRRIICAGSLYFARNGFHIVVPVDVWKEEASIHREEMLSKLYPPGNVLKTRQHATKEHPIYNFLHRYYRYSVNDVLKYSPGIGVSLQYDDVDRIDQLSDSLHTSFLSIDKFKHSMSFDIAMLHEKLSPNLKFGWIDLSHNWKTLETLNRRAPFYGCFGFHEWAMLYSGRNSAKLGGQGQLKKHQETLRLRVTQEAIDEVVETGPVRCTHFDAWRFFHPDAQTLNVINPLTRQSQTQYEQPGCIHANMDLFRYAYQLYPFVPSRLLRTSLDIAIRARKIDMRASPYDCSDYEECKEGPIFVETKDGRLQYAQEQEALYHAATPVREELLAVYSQVLSSFQQKQALESAGTEISVENSMSI